MVLCSYIVLVSGRVLTPHSIPFRSEGLGLYIPHDTLHYTQRTRFLHHLTVGEFLSAFAKLRKATVSFVMSVLPYALLHGTIRLPLDGFS